MASQTTPSPVSSPAGSSAESSTASPTTSTASSSPGSETLAPSVPVGPPRESQYQPPPCYAASMPPQQYLAGYQGAYAYSAPHPRYVPILSPYDLLVSYKYFSEPQGFKPYHFRQCFMPASGAYVVVEKTWSTQADLDAHRQLLLRGHAGCYADLRHRCVPNPPDPVRRPKVQVCPLLSSEMQLAIDRAADPRLQAADPKVFARLRHLARAEDRLAFFAVVQGNGDGAASKLVVRTSFYQIMTEIFTAAANQLSVVFSGAMREEDLPRLGRGARSSCMRALGIKRRVRCEWEWVHSELTFKRVDNYDDLLADDPDKNVIRIGC